MLANNLSGGLVGLLGVVQVFLFHNSVVLKVCWLINTSVEGLGAGSITSLSVGLSEHVFTLNAGNVASIAYKYGYPKAFEGVQSYLGSAFWERRLRLSHQPLHRT